MNKYYVSIGNDNEWEYYLEAETEQEAVDQAFREFSDAQFYSSQQITDAEFQAQDVDLSERDYPDSDHVIGEDEYEFCFNRSSIYWEERDLYLCDRCYSEEKD